MPKTPPGERLLARPAFGAAPLTVTFSSVYGYPERTQDAGVVLIFGDGRRAPVHCILDDAKRNGECAERATLQHTFEKPGIYRARLVRGGMCVSPPCEVEVGNVRVIVTSGMAAPVILSGFAGLLLASMAGVVGWKRLRKRSG